MEKNKQNISSQPQEPARYSSMGKIVPLKSNPVQEMNSLFTSFSTPDQAARPRTEENRQPKNILFSSHYELSQKEENGMRYVNPVLSPELEDVRKMMCKFEGLLRLQFGKRINKEMRRDLTAYLAQKFFSIPPEEVTEKIDLAGDSKDVATKAIQSIRDLIAGFSDVFVEYSPRIDLEATGYAENIKILADSMNLAKTPVFIHFTGEPLTDVKIYKDLIALPDADTMTKFQVTLLFLMEMLADLPMLLSEPAETLLNFVESLRTIDSNTPEVLKFIDRMCQRSKHDFETEKSGTPLSDPLRNALELCRNPEGVSAVTIREHIGGMTKSVFDKNVLKPLKQQGYIEPTIDNPNSPNQKYRITAAGAAALACAKPCQAVPDLCRSDSAGVPADPGVRQG